MFSTKWAAFKKKSQYDHDGCCASDEPEIRRIAHELWEKAGKPEGRSDHFWSEAKKQIATERFKPVERESNYVCDRCGARAYFDGRCGDGPILMCRCGYSSQPIPASEYKSRGWW